jgi:hypothetical protein
MIDNGTNFQDIIDRMVKVSLKRKLLIAIKLIDLSQSLNYKKKLPTLNPACLKIAFNDSMKNDFSVEINKDMRED